VNASDALEQTGPHNQTWAVHRQDDNGNRFFVEGKLTRNAAERLVEELTARGHKQFYWAEPEAS
jgi:hypothetical protein